MVRDNQRMLTARHVLRWKTRKCFSGFAAFYGKEKLDQEEKLGKPFLTMPTMLDQEMGFYSSRCVGFPSSVKMDSFFESFVFKLNEKLTYLRKIK